MSEDVKEFLKRYVPLVDFIAEIVGKNSEVVLHDLTNLNSSVIAIRNNHITNRKVGAPATDLVLKILKDTEMKKKDYITNYKGISKNIAKTLKSSTFFIRYEEEIVGMLCVNTDVTAFYNAKEGLEKLFSFYINESTLDLEENESENFASSMEEISEQIISEVTGSIGVGVEYLKSDDKIEIIDRLNDKGFFLLKGSVQEIAKSLNISEPTVYRYIQIIKSKR